MADLAFQRCINPACRATVDLADTAFHCPKCGGLLDVAYDWNRLPVPKSLAHFESKWSRRTEPLDFSGVWRFRELLPFAKDEQILSIGEGQTLCQRADGVAGYVGMKPGCLFLQYEGMNPSGSFKDNGMNPCRLEGQKTIMYRVLEALRWEVPDWIVVPGGNLGNSSAFGKAFMELVELGLIKKAPRIAIINAAGADTFFQIYEKHGVR